MTLVLRVFVGLSFFLLFGCESKIVKIDFPKSFDDSTVFERIIEFEKMKDDDVSIFRKANEFSPATVMKFKRKNKKLYSVELIELDIYKGFYPKSGSGEYYYSQSVASEKHYFFDVNYLETPQSHNLKLFDKKSNKVIGTPSYYILKSEFKNVKYIDRYSIENLSKNEILWIEWLENISHRISFKEDMSFKLFTRKMDVRDLWKFRFGNDEFMDSLDKIKYIIPNSQFKNNWVYEK